MLRKRWARAGGKEDAPEGTKRRAGEEEEEAGTAMARRTVAGGGMDKAKAAQIRSAGIAVSPNSAYVLPPG